MKNTTFLSVSLAFFFLFFGQKNAFAQAGLIGEYYDGENFNTKIMTRTDAKIDFNWGFDAPNRGMNSEHFSIRWHGKLLAPVSGEYLFQAKVDDGLRLWLDDKRVIDAWGLNDAVQYKGTIYLEAGKKYDIKVEYYNGMLNSMIQLFWKRPDQKSLFDAVWDNSQIIENTYFFQPDLPKPIEVVPMPKKEIKKPTPPNKAVAKKTTPKLPSAAEVAAKKQAEQATMLDQAKRELEPQFIYFVQSTNEILPTSQTSLNEWVHYLEKMPSANLQIQGFTDALGDQKMNFTLSEQRAKAVANYLVAHGIASTRLTPKGLGGTQPIFKNPRTEKERSLNRRVEIKIFMGT
jgi:peptidoglycan-binding protein ArfA